MSGVAYTEKIENGSDPETEPSELLRSFLGKRSIQSNCGNNKQKINTIAEIKKMKKKTTMKNFHEPVTKFKRTSLQKRCDRDYYKINYDQGRI